MPNRKCYIVQTLDHVRQIKEKQMFKMNKIKELIAKGKTVEAFQELEITLSEKQDYENLDKTLLLKAQFNRWKENDLRGLAPSKHELNKIQSSLFEICNLLTVTV